MPLLLPAVLMLAVLPALDQMETITAGEEAEVDLSSGDGWVRVLEDDYTCLRVPGIDGVQILAFDGSGNILCSSDPGDDMYLSAFSDYWFYLKLVPDPGRTEGTAALRVDTLAPVSLASGERMEGAVGRNGMAMSYDFSPNRTGSWTFRLEGTSSTDLDLKVYGTGMRLWGESMSTDGFETVTVPVLPGETVTAVVSRYDKAGSGEFLLSVHPSGQFPELGPSGASGSISVGEVHRFLVPKHDSMFFLDLVIRDPGADLDLLLRDDSGGFIMASRSYASVETLLLPPSVDVTVADILLFDPGEVGSVSYTLRSREAGRVHGLIPVRRTVAAGSPAAMPVGFSPAVTGLFRVGANFEKTRDGDTRVFRGPGEPSLTFASARGDEEFLLYVPAGDTIWIDPFYQAVDVEGDADISISPAGTVHVEDRHSGYIDPDEPAAFMSVSAEAGTILDIRLSGGHREIDLDMLVSGPGIDLAAEGWLSSVDAAGDEAVAVHARRDSEYGITVYLYDRDGETSFDLEVGRIISTPLADPSPLPETWALSGGISGYPSAEDVLNRASMDAVEFYEFLAHGQEIPEDHLILLVDGMCTVDAFMGGMASLLERAGPEDRVVVFYSGHGDRSHPGSGGPEEEDGANEQLCLYDGDVSDDLLSGLVDSLAGAPVFLFFDACHSGGFVNDFSEGDEVMVLTAAREDLSVSERILTPLLLRGSRGDADSDGNGYVSALELLAYIDERLQLICPECDAELSTGSFVCPNCGAVLKGDNAVPRPEQGMFLTEDIDLWKVLQ